jgi:hypothetical protein
MNPQAQTTYDCGCLRLAIHAPGPPLRGGRDAPCDLRPSFMIFVSFVRFVVTDCGK